ncbi:YdeI/OmpD-associated family protein [Dyadobacter sediminis]|uniref:Bacteriocin-protection protein n=1 Tax=Dyadobacter sediminis TaxID=1493691 RepID=A0A5R9KJI0_9BACT|nr:YdeI/OmpD-associated family protein [Dyadobacter sediminis]TLU96381.1 hypothetical protein FEM55_04390 [Dyadobacter sediminis]GGB81755.1 hypothetical protein GCM10011325_06560 [Dyadobacter sediminis]
MTEKEIQTYCPASKQQWRAWLMENHAREKSVWLIYHKKKSGVPTITWSEAVDEALCFGWIDSLSRQMDENRFMQFFTRRKPNSVWSKINKEKVNRFIEAGLMTQAGLEVINIAKQNGSWNILDEVEERIIPADLQAEFNRRPDAGKFYQTLCKSDQRNLLQWLVLAKRPETRQKRISEIVELTDRNQKPAIIQTGRKS